MLVRSGDDPSTTSSSADWGRTDHDMNRPEAASATDSRPECVPEDAHYVPVRAETLVTEAVAQMASGRGFLACLGGDAPILVPGSGGCELVSVDFEEVVGGAHESRLT
jgi:hypothetical protein